MSDIQEQIKLAHKRAEENDLSLRERQKLNGMTLGEEQQLYWEEFKKTSYDDLQNRIDKAIEYIEENIEIALVNGESQELIDQEDIPIILNILKGDNK